ncbi:hypothetical protein G7074_21155 [Pedobacter sp. HDW13]|uniref:DUF5694 domain-containing protein n=1 Tax=unclassified Pedobacter TaxID=2628915 RepID=UPI000F5A7489|nr:MULTISPECIES: DUF5694 domain-containing protein [unclassified Pedobacter]QIL41550.1 hypothetical protein G7074_21155 [Pedobacter sp. HDW13]RQO77874.1 hypothetical protein DBR40_07865 [Pedobacter sp. KBW01]
MPALKNISLINLLVYFFFSSTGFSQHKTNVVLIGIYHFNNPGFDEGKMKDRNILSDENQQGLDRITGKLIRKYRPDKVFVEYDASKNNKLNAMYSLYKNAKPFYNADTLNAFNRRFYSENETFQLGFRLAKKARNDSIYAMDYDDVPIRFDLIKSKLQANRSFTYADYQEQITELEVFMNACLSKPRLEDVLLGLNSQEQYQLNKGLYISFLNRVNQPDDFFGSDLVAAWYKRNLIMYSNIQNQVSAGDNNIVIIIGAGHAAIMEDFIKADKRFNLVKLNGVL